MKDFQENAVVDLVEGARSAETEQRAVIERTTLDESYEGVLALYIQAKHSQVEHIEDRLENLIDRQQACLQQTQAVVPGKLSLPATRKAWQNLQTQQQSRLQTLHSRLEAVREIKDGMGLHAPKLEELAIRKLRAENHELAEAWDSANQIARRHDLLRRKQEQEKKQTKTLSSGRTLSLASRMA